MNITKVLICYVYKEDPNSLEVNISNDIKFPCHVVRVTV